MTIFRTGGELYHAEGSRLVWSTTSRPALLLPDDKITLTSVDIAWPDLAKANAYAYNSYNVGSFTYFAAASYITMVPQEWDSGTSLLATIPAGCNYFQVDVNISRINTPSPYLTQPLPQLIQPGQWQTLDGASAIAERIGPLVRIFRLERSGNSIYLRRKQSVANDGQVLPWNSGNSPTFPGGGQQPGWTWGGSGGANGHPVSQRATTALANSNRGQSNQVTVSDNTNYASTWRGTIVITPGYINA